MEGLQILEGQYERERKEIRRRHARHPEGLPEVERAALVKQLQAQMALWAESGGDEKAFPLAPELEKLMTAPDTPAEDTAPGSSPETTPEDPAPDTAADATPEDPAPDTGPDAGAPDTSGSKGRGRR